VALGSGHNELSVPVTRELPILFIGLFDLFNDRGRGNCLGVPWKGMVRDHWATRWLSEFKGM
jgi:hypothetical protein